GNFLLGIEYAQHAVTMQHANGPARPGHIVGAVETAAADLVVFAVDLQGFVSVERDVEVRIRVHLVYRCPVTQATYQARVLHFSNIGKSRREPGNHWNFNGE